MKAPSYFIDGIPVIELNTVIVGSGAAALSCADSLYKAGTRDIAIVTEGLKMGTSRNTGSDKQTYYKLSSCADKPDSAEEMAKDLFAGGSMHGDIALVEALSSLRAFYRLVALGVPFPHSPLGEYTGYRTDHDTRSRATSCGPLTSKYMTEALEAAVKADGIDIYDCCRVIAVLTKKGEAKNIAVGVAALKVSADGKSASLIVFAAKSTVYAVGGPSSVYAKTVYPESQTCALGAALLAGASAVNLTESQYGLASLKFRWNLSGSYQQVVPRYISTLPDGSDEREFLLDYFTESEAAAAVFRKGYEWPFDAAKLTVGARSSRVDLAVFIENLKGRRTYLDFTTDPAGITSDAKSRAVYGDEAFEYLERSDALGASPIERLKKLNYRAYELYLDHGIDLAKEWLEIGVCAQHCNGGLEADTNYESVTLSGFFPIGEVNGTFGVRRPGGSALNSTQVGAIRASECISRDRGGAPEKITRDMLTLPEKLFSLMKDGGATRREILDSRLAGGTIMDKGGAFLRGARVSSDALAATEAELSRFFDDASAEDGAALVELCINYDTLITRRAMLASVNEYISHGGKSRGSYVISELTPKELIASNKASDVDTEHTSLILQTRLTESGDIVFDWEKVREIPHENNWFELLLAAQKD